MSARLALALPAAAVSLLLGGGPALAGTTGAPHVVGSKRFCGESTTLVRDLLAFGKLPKTTASVSAALTRVDRELKQLALDAPTRGDRSTIVMMRAEFAHLKMIVLTDPAGTSPANRAFVAGFGKTSVKQGLTLGGEIKAACH